MLVYSHTDCLLKDNGFNHPERKERISSILDSIKQITDFLPKLNDINSNTLFKAHNFKTTESMAITNLNKEKIAKLSNKQLHIIKSIFKKDHALLSYFNYSIIEAQ